jgi:hypothetical protein
MLAATMLAAAPAAASKAGAAQSTEEFRWQGRVAQGRAVEVFGVNGDVRAELSGSGQVEVLAVKRGRRQDPTSVRIEVVEHGAGVTICAVYPTPDGRPPNDCVPGGGKSSVNDNDVQVEFTVRVPAGVELTGSTVNGSIDAEGMQSVVRLETVNGSVSFSTTEYGEGRTVNGSVTGRLGRADWPDELEFTTVNGAITLTFAVDLNAEIQASTLNGTVETDFPIEVSGSLSRRRVRGRIGAGGRDMRLSSVNGTIRLRRGD